VGGVIDVHVVQLDVLSGRDMQDRVGALLSKVTEHLQLTDRHATAGGLDALHARRIPQRVRPLRLIWMIADRLGLKAVVALAVALALPVGAPSESRLSKDFVVQSAFSLEEELLFIGVDFGGPVGTDLGLEGEPPGLRFHVCLSRRSRARERPAGNWPAQSGRSKLTHGFTQDKRIKTELSIGKIDDKVKPAMLTL